MTFDQFFKTAFGLPENSEVKPFAYQRRLAGDTECKSRLIEIPTGLGKTDESSVVREDSPDEWGSLPPLTEEQRALVEKLVTDGLSIQHKFKPEPLYKKTGKGHYAGKTVEEIRQARKRTGDDDIQSIDESELRCVAAPPTPKHRKPDRNSPLNPNIKPK